MGCIRFGLGSFDGGTCRTILLIVDKDGAKFTLAAFGGIHCGPQQFTLNTFLAQYGCSTLGDSRFLI